MDGEVVLYGNMFRLVRWWFVKCPTCKAQCGKPCLPSGCSQPWEEQSHTRGAQPWVDAKRVLKPRRSHQVTGGSESGPGGAQTWVTFPELFLLFWYSVSVEGCWVQRRVLCCSILSECPCVRGVASDRTFAYGVHTCRSKSGPGLKGGVPTLFREWPKQSETPVCVPAAF